jgi:uncharacterized repeat protein (TIGR01451 family)
LGPAPAKGGTYNVVAQFEEVRFCGESWSASASPGYQVIAKVTVPSQRPDLSLKNKVSPSPVVSGNTLTYTITVTNTGGEIAKEVRLEDLIPESGSATRTTRTADRPQRGWATVRPRTLDDSDGDAQGWWGRAPVRRRAASHSPKRGRATIHDPARAGRPC